METVAGAAASSSLKPKNANPNSPAFQSIIPSRVANSPLNVAAVMDVKPVATTAKLSAFPINRIMCCSSSVFSTTFNPLDVRA